MTTWRIDAHQHYWTTQRSDYGWLTPALPTLYQDFQPNDLAPLLHQYGIDKSIVVQAAASVAETEYLLTLADTNDSIAAVVGWVDMLADDASATISQFAQHKKFKALRPMLQDLPQDDWISMAAHQTALDSVVQVMLEHELVFDALVQPRHLSPLHLFAQRHPLLPIVINHAGKPNIAESAWQPWSTQMAALACLPNVRCKLSGLITEASPDWVEEHLRPYVNYLIQHFGAGRLIWGSDWPVLNLNGSYADWWNASEILLDALSDAEREAVFGTNANAVYRLML
ncbi:amidohydrolase family protein [Herbaspirillum sp. RTI4]|uniref:amidohydrolase family protein n=1 Tax=Herbaspirillum sp. RTI4 TaxID=3048640 RepID=UPI002AB47CB3|nr:amidohydrolase family protein [Herbaspirillum sp. RTI4]MDY7578774.1 amidohydrolase family protein [Herbaspirillum sp. RTI4]MEA9982306.1 amidohydrolase family protein [Herbaspirillum sp. RTI4]